jgi:hypothetical protein
MVFLVCNLFAALLFSLARNPKITSTLSFFGLSSIQKITIKI